MQTPPHQTQPALRERLDERLAHLRRRVDRLERESGTVREVEVRSLVESALVLDRDEMARVGAALRRIANREIDVCISCGGSIDIILLERSPFTVNCRGCSAGFPSEYAGRLRLQHHQLRKRLDRLRSVVRTAAARPTPLQDEESMALREAVHDLGAELAEHFAEEERGGYMADALAHAPRVSRRAAALREEHTSLLADWRGLEARARAGADTGWREIARELEEICRRIAAHERKENDLLSAAFLEDQGGGD